MITYSTIVDTEKGSKQKNLKKNYYTGVSRSKSGSPLALLA